jgi:hypothetical protein
MFATDFDFSPDTLIQHRNSTPDRPRMSLPRNVALRSRAAPAPTDALPGSLSQPGGGRQRGLPDPSRRVAVPLPDARERRHASSHTARALAMTGDKSSSLEKTAVMPQERASFSVETE